jgi:hypothetical protein
MKEKLKLTWESRKEVTVGGLLVHDALITGFEERPEQVCLADDVKTLVSLPEGYTTDEHGDLWHGDMPLAWHTCEDSIMTTSDLTIQHRRAVATWLLMMS